MLHAVEAETGRFFHFEGSEGLPLEHFAITAEGSRAEMEERAVPFREGEEVHVDLVEPHMYSEDDAVAKVDGYLIEVADGIPYVGEKKLVRIEQAGRTAARAVLAGPEAEEAQGRHRGAPRGARALGQAARRRPPARAGARRRRPRPPLAPEAGGRGGRGARRGRRAAARGRHRAGRRGGRRRGRGEAARGGGARRRTPTGTRAARAARRGGGGRRGARAADGGARDGRGATEPLEAADPADESEDGSADDDAVHSKTRRRGRRGGRRRSRAKAGADAADVSEASE